MKFSERAEKCGLSPMRKFYPFSVAAEKAGKRIYHLNIGQPDIATPRAYFDAVRAFDQDVLAYAESPGIPALIHAMEKYYRRLGVELQDGDVLVTTGGSEALQIAMNCILNEGDEVVVPEPFYPNYATYIRSAGGVIRPIPTSVEEGYAYAFRDRVEAALNERTRAILLSNPGNPTGVVLTREELKLFADIARERDLFLVADEVYREFIYGGGELSSMAQFDGIGENLILIDSVSKRFSACGARIGALISRNSAFMGHALKYCQARLSVSTMGQVAAAALYETTPADYFTAVREEYRRRRDVVIAGLRRIPGALSGCPDGAFYLMARLPVEDTDSFQKWLLTDFEDRGETVMFAPGAPFYATPGMGRDEIRIAYVLNEKDLERAVELLGLGLQKYPGTLR